MGAGMIIVVEGNNLSNPYWHGRVQQRRFAPLLSLALTALPIAQKSTWSQINVRYFSECGASMRRRRREDHLLPIERRPGESPPVPTKKQCDKHQTPQPEGPR
jgi:hypothetical protein